MKNVLVLNQFALPRTEGGGTRHIDLFSRATGWRHRIVAGHRNHYSQEVFTTTDETFTLVPVPAQSGSGMQRLASWLAYITGAILTGLRTRRLDAVYASTPHLLTPVAGWLLARLRRVPFILEIRDLWPESFVAAGLMRRGTFVHRAFCAMEAFVVRRADVIVCVTAGWEAHLMSLGATVDDIVVVPNGTERTDFAVDTPRETLRAEFGFDGPVAIFAGAHGPKDGIDQILDAARAVPDVRFLMYGAGPVKEEAIERAARESLTNVEFHEPVPKKDLARVLAACDIGIHSITPLPVFELGMSPNKLFDYLAAGLPVVSNAGTPIQALIGQQCGPVGDSDSLAAGVRHLVDAGDEGRRRYGQAGPRLIDERFSRTAASATLVTTLNRLTEKDRGTS